MEITLNIPEWGVWIIIVIMLGHTIESIYKLVEFFLDRKIKRLKDDKARKEEV
jgi:hypothetical protein